MADESIVLLLSLVVLAFTLAGLFVSIFYSLPFAIARYKENRIPPQTAIDAYSCFQLWNTVIATAVLVSFLMLALSVLFLPEGEMSRVWITRLSILSGIVLSTIQVMLGPAGQRRVESARARELKERNDRDSSEC